MNGIILKAKLKSLKPFLETKNLVELSVVRAGEVGLEIAGEGYQFHQAPHLDYDYWKSLCHILANGSGTEFHEETQPRISTALPGGHRFEALLGKGVEGGISVSVRLYRSLPVELENFGLKDELKDRILRAVKEGQTLIVSGGTSSGKTTFLNCLIGYIPLHKRILTVEDTRELQLPHKNKACYIVDRHKSNSASLTYPQVIDHLMRSRPDIIISGELSIPNAFPILRLLNTGHGGFMCTVHANSPELALDEAVPTNIRMSGIDVPDAAGFLRKTVDVVIQLHKVGLDSRSVTEVWFPKLGEKVVVVDGYDHSHAGSPVTEEARVA